MTSPEYSRLVDIRQADGHQIELAANEEERAALATRFDLVRIDRLEARLSVTSQDQIVAATGSMDADFVQRCAVSAEDMRVTVSEEISLRFVPERLDYKPDEEIEIDAEDCDDIEYSGTSFDLGEAVAQSLALAIDPFATGPQAEQARSLLKSSEVSPFEALASLKLPPEEKNND